MALLQRIRGEAAWRVAYPVAERLTGRDIRAKQDVIARDWTRRADEKRQQAMAELAAIVAWAGATVPYYRDLFAGLAFDPAKLAHDPKFLSDLPHLTKDIIRAEGSRLLSERHAGRPRHLSRTGGSTGPAAEIYFDQEAADWSSAVTRHARSAIGKPHFLSELHLASRFPERFPLKDRLKERAKCFAMNRHNLFIEDFEPASLGRLWQQIERSAHIFSTATPPRSTTLRGIVTPMGEGQRAFQIFELSGELLEARQRETIRRVFGCRVVDRYGLAEFGVVAYQMSDEESRIAHL